MTLSRDRFAGFIDRQFEPVAELIAAYDDRVFPVDTSRLSDAVSYACADIGKELVAVGNGAWDVMQDWTRDRSIVAQPVEVLAEARARERRLLSAKALSLSSGGRYFVDDVIVSGNTMKTAMSAGNFGEGDEVVTGMLFDSKTARRRIGVPINAAIEYRQQGGGIPSVNSLSTLAANPGMVQDYVARKGLDRLVMEAVLNIYKGGGES